MWQMGDTVGKPPWRRAPGDWNLVLVDLSFLNLTHSGYLETAVDLLGQSRPCPPVAFFLRTGMSVQ